MLLQNPRSSRWRVGLERTLLSRTPASADLDSDALISAPPEGDASSTVPTPRARGWRSLTRTRPSSDVLCRLRGHRCVGSDRPPAAMSDISSCDSMHPWVDPRGPGSHSYDRFRTARPLPGRLSSYRAVATFVVSGTRRAASTPQASPRTLSLRPHRGGAFNAVAFGAFEARSSEPLAALQHTRT